MKKLDILLDLDAICVNLHDSWYGAYNKDWNDTLTVDKVTAWNTHKFAKPECVFPDRGYDKPGTGIYFYLELPEVHLDAKPIEGAVDALQRLSIDGHNLVVCTSAMATEHTPSQKIKWCQKHLWFIPKNNIFVGHLKHMIRADVFIDDCPDNVRKYRQANPDATIMSIRYPYNEGVTEYDLSAVDYKDPRGAWDHMERAIRMKADGSKLWG